MLSNTLFSVKQFFLNALENYYTTQETNQLFIVLTTSILQLNKVQQMTQPTLRISESEINKYTNAINELKNYRPIQYIVGYEYFLGNKFIVNKDVLIPRPETEELVNIIFKKYKNINYHAIDLCTGSGCIAISLYKHSILKPSIKALDISKEAIAVAKENANVLNADIEFIIADIINQPNFNFDLFDFIVSNPPYVLEKEKAEMQDNVLQHEPHLALFVNDENPLLFYNKITHFAKKYLKKDGHLYFEINDKYAQKTSLLLEENGFKNIVIHQDIHKKNRMIAAQL